MYLRQKEEGEDFTDGGLYDISLLARRFRSMLLDGVWGGRGGGGGGGEE